MVGLLVVIHFLWIQESKSVYDIVNVVTYARFSSPLHYLLGVMAGLNTQKSIFIRFV